MGDRHGQQKGTRVFRLTYNDAVIIGPSSKQLFIYGSFMEGGLYGDLLSEDPETRLLGPARCRGSLYDLGSRAALVKEGRAWVAGELYRCRDIDRTLAILDAVDPETPLRRQIGPVRWKHGETMAWLYLYEGSLAAATAVPGGSWKAWLRSRRRES